VVGNPLETLIDFYIWYVEEQTEKPETNTDKGVGSDFIYIYWD
jgi:hypothetical protein